MIQRRAVASAIAGVLLPAAPAGRAQPASKPARIGWLSGGAYPGTPLWEAFIEGMRERGWIEGRDFTVEHRLSEGRSERFPALAAELVQRNVDLIVCGGGTPSATAAMNATQTIPIVFFYVGDPVGSGLVDSLARPGRNLTGTGGLGTGLYVKQLDLLKETVPKASRIAMLINSASLPNHASARPEIDAGARSLGVTLVAVEMRSPDDIEAAFAKVVEAKVDALLILGQPFLFAHAARIAKPALEQRLPAIVGFKDLADAGVLMAYGDKLIDHLRRLPHYVDRILKGARPADLPVEQSTRFYLTINLKTAKALGLTMPQTVMLRADEVIE